MPHSIATIRLLRNSGYVMIVRLIVIGRMGVIFGINRQEGNSANLEYHSHPSVLLHIVLYDRDHVLNVAASVIKFMGSLAHIVLRSLNSVETDVFI